MAGEELRDDAQVDEGRGADLEAVRNAASLAVDVEAKLSLGVLGSEIDLTGWCVDALGGDDEVVDELLHLLEYLFLLGEAALAVDDVHRTIGDGVDGLAQDPEALAHLLDADEVAVVAVADSPDRDVEIILLVIEVGMGFADVVFDAGSAEHRAGQAIGDGILLGDDTDVLGAVDEDRVAGE